MISGQELRASPGSGGQTAGGMDPSWVLVPAGLGLLLIRPLFASGPAGVWLLAITYLAVGGGSVLAMQTQPAGGVGARSPQDVPVAVLAGVLVLGMAVFALAAAGQQTVHVRYGSVGLGLTGLASVAEEAFFRGLVYRRLARYGAPLAILAGAGGFALIHVLAYPPAALWVDLGAGLVFGWQRWATGSWLVPAGTHLMANLLVVMA
jgi:membrane protease YdiL (CAAX protease family)